MTDTLTDERPRIWNDSASNITSYIPATVPRPSAQMHEVDEGLSSGSSLQFPVLTPRRPINSRRGSAITDVTEAVGPTRRWLKYVTMRLNEIAARKDDFEGVPRASSEAVSQAFEFAYLHLPPYTSTPSVGTSPDGGVEFSWHEGGWELEIEIEPLDQMVWARNRDSGETWEGTFSELSALVAMLLRDFAA